MVLTIDSGASENVISEAMASQQNPTRPSTGSQRALAHTDANGTNMTNKAEKVAKSYEGNNCMMKMQVTDVQCRFVSVSRICDAGRRAFFTIEGDYLQHEATGQVTPFYRDHTVYCMEVEPIEGCNPGFTWQGNGGPPRAGRKQTKACRWRSSWTQRRT